MTSAALSYPAKPRPNKARSYEFLFGDLSKPVATAFLMPGAKCLDVRDLMARGVVTTDTKLYVVERDTAAHLEMADTLRSLGFRRPTPTAEGTLFDIQCELHQLDAAFLPPRLDLAYIDLLGSILLDDARWMAAVLTPRLHRGTRLALTIQMRHRNNEWVEEFWRAANENAPDLVRDFVESHGYGNVFADQPALWTKAILHGFDFRTTNFVYTDNPSNVYSEMMAMRMEDFEARPDPQAFFSHAAAEALMDAGRVEEFYQRRIGETAAETRAKLAEARRAAAERTARLECHLDASGEMLVVKDGRTVRVMHPNNTWTAFGSVAEVCRHHGIA